MLYDHNSIIFLPKFVTEEEDYLNFNSSQLTFPANEDNVCIKIVIQDDTILEPVQTFAVILSSTNTFVNIIANKSIISIVDNDSKLLVSNLPILLN